MGFIMDRMLSSMKMLSDSDEVDVDMYEDVDDFDEERENTRTASRKKTMKNSEMTQDNDDYDLEEEVEERRPFFRKKNDNDVVERDSEPTRIVSVEPQRKVARSVRNLPAAQGIKQSEVKMLTPLTYDEAKDIVELLLQGKVVVLNLERIKVDLGQKIIDFTAGACYTMGGDMQSISRKIFIATPSNVALSGDFTNILTGNGTMDFSMLNINT